jgi:hypothetical protein
MAEPLAYLGLRRQLIPKNPYFQRDLIEVRQKLGIPQAGFDAAVEELGKGIPRHPTGLLLGKPDLTSLKEKARQLGLPLEDWLAERETLYAQRGMNFHQEAEEVGWGALPIWGYALAEWWLGRERKTAGLEPLTSNLPPGSLPDPRLPSAQAAFSLSRRYQLGDDYAWTVVSMILGCPPGGGEADVIVQPRRDGAGLSVTLTCVRYDCTLAEWQQIFLDCIQPTLLYALGKVPAGIPGHQALKEARRRVRPGRPPYTPEVLERHLRMWEFCHHENWLAKGLSSTAFEAFLNSLSDDDEQKPEFEKLDVETFRRSVRKLDRLLRPTGSEPDFRS